MRTHYGIGEIFKLFVGVQLADGTVFPQGTKVVVWKAIGENLYVRNYEDYPGRNTTKYFKIPKTYINSFEATPGYYVECSFNEDSEAKESSNVGRNWTYYAQAGVGIILGLFISYLIIKYSK